MVSKCGLWCRYRLWMLVWKYWTGFVRGRKQRRAIKQLAICHSML